MKTNNIKKLLGDGFCAAYNLDVDKEYEISFVKAKSLIKANRLDLIAKYKYVEAYLNNYDGSFFSDLYEKHIDAFTNGTFVEVNQRETKNSKEAFFNIFHDLINDIKVNGIDPEKSVIPVGKDNTIVDGAHRVAVAAYLDLEVPVIYLNDIEADNGASFFEERYLAPNYLYYLIQEYCRMKDIVYTACFWPLSNSKPELHEKAEEMLKSVCNVVYKTKIPTDVAILRNFMIQVYSQFNWLGGLEDHFVGASAYAEQVHHESGYLTLYVLEGGNLDDVTDMKSKIREMFGLGNHALHISDTHDEAMNILQMTLNKNSQHCLKYSEPDKYKKFNYAIYDFKDKLKEYNIDDSMLALDSGSVLSLYGLRETDDIDFISPLSIVMGDKKYEQHIGKEYFYSATPADIINDPDKHLFYYGLKFISVPLLIDMKKRRFEADKAEKDKDDIYLLNSIDNTKTFASKLKKFSVWFNRQKRNLIYKLMDLVIHSIFYKPLRFVYYKMKGKPLPK